MDRSEVIKKYVIVFYFSFHLARIDLQINGKDSTKNHATKATKKPKTKLTKYVMSINHERMAQNC